MDPVCEIFNTIMQGFLWKADVHAVAELFPIAAFFILAFKVYRKKFSVLRLSDFRLEVALLLPWAITQGVRAFWVFTCLME